MPEKNQAITNYITNISKQLNEQYKGIMSDDKIQKVIEMFQNSFEILEYIIKKINELAEQAIKNYIEEREKRYNPELVKKNHEEIYSKLETLIQKLNEKGVDYQLAGALCAYIKYGEESQRTHDDIDINLNEKDISKFKEVCEEMGLHFKDDRMTTPRVLKNGIPAGEHEVIATLDDSDFHIGAFCFERLEDGTIVNKGYYHNDAGEIFTRNDIMPPEMAREVFGRETVDFRGHPIIITPPEYVYKLKSYTKKDKDMADIAFMEDRIDKEKLQRLSSLSSRVEHVRVETLNNDIGQNFNYHTHTMHSGHSKNSSDEEILEAAKKAGFTMLGFSEHIPNPSLVLPDEDNRMLLSEVDEYISSINALKQKNPRMTILSGFEAEYDPMKESFLGEMRDKVDYMILGQHFVSRGLAQVSPNNNPNYPIEYANMISKAIDSGIFDIVAHPDIFMKYRDTMETEETKKLFDENSILASQIICEKARDMGIPIEINFGSTEKNATLSDGKLEYPHPAFWDVAKEIEGLKVLYGVDAHNLGAFENIKESYDKVSQITEMVSDKIIKENYSPVIARQNNPKLQEAYRKGQANALTFESQMVNQLLTGIANNIPNELDSENIAIGIGTGLNSAMQSCVDAASRKDNNTISEISKIAEDSTELSISDKKARIEREKKVVDETNRVLASQQGCIENAKNNVLNAMNMGCERKEEYINVVTQLTEHNTTKNLEHKQQIEEHISSFQQTKTGEKVFQNQIGQARQLKKTNPNPNANSSNGFVDVILLSLFVTFVIGVAVGIGYMLFKISIG